MVLPNRHNFAVQFGSENPTGVFQLLQQACLEMIKISYHVHMKGSGVCGRHVYQGFVYSRFMWGEFVFVDMYSFLVGKFVRICTRMVQLHIM